MYSIDMTSNDVDKQIYLLKHFPDIAVKHFRPALKLATDILRNTIEPLIPLGVTGRARDTFGSKVTGKTITGLKGRVGWFDKGPWYIGLIHDGAKSHTIEPRKKVSWSAYQSGSGTSSTLRWMEGGDFVFTKSVNHPGFTGSKFMEVGFRSKQSTVETMMADASDNVVRELAAI